MATEELEVTISPTGEVSIKASGFTGSSCLTATADLERSLGGEVVHREMTSEAYQRIEAQEEIRLRQGGRQSW